VNAIEASAANITAEMIMSYKFQIHC
jgi:hypothetical protein